MKRKLSPEDIKFWKTQMRGVKPLPKTKIELEEPTEIPIPKIGLIQEKAKRLPLSSAPLYLGPKKMRHIKIDARLDLHGMTLEEGHDALESFLRRAQQKGFKAVLVITGKGSLSSERTLRRQLPQWLEEPPLRQFVTFLQHPAKQKDGGAGASYVGVKRKSTTPF